MSVDITIDENKECNQCGGKWATQKGICLECIRKNLAAGKYDGIFKKLRRDMTKARIRSKWDI